jgi:hypothetical protein
MTSKVNLTSSAVNGWPSDQVTPSRSLKVTVRPSSESPPFSTLGSSAASTGSKLPSGLATKSGSCAQNDRNEPL